MSTREQRKIISETLRGLRASDAETVFINAGQILKVIPYERTVRENLFKNAVETEDVIIERHKPTSVIPKSETKIKSLLAEVDRELCISLLLEYERKLSE